MASSEHMDCVRQLLQNPKPEFLKTANLLLKVVRNIQDNPSVAKYRSIKIGGKTFMESILPVDGAVQCLLEMGFTESGDRFLFSDDPSGTRLENTKKSLEKAIQSVQNQSPRQSAPGSKDQSDESVRSSEKEILMRLESYFQHVLVYQDARAQEKARSVIPQDILKKKAQDRLDKRPEFTSSNGKIPLNLSDCFILELLHWFKHDFFKWIDSPECHNCPGAKRTPMGSSAPTREELRWDAHRVEMYRCNNCGSGLRYPRYNNPEKLLETRGGRCGEWANCFTLLCIALGYEARHVIDWTDHVWTEVYSTTVKRWIHLDPCENAFDKPLMYEKGWGKKLSLIIGLSRYEVSDVTWRYVDNVNDVMARRRAMFRENWLRGVVSKMSRRRQVGIGAQSQSSLRDRIISEMIEFVSPRVESGVVYEGRTTGALEWRRARGEMGESGERDSLVRQLVKDNQGTIHMQYFSAEDKYVAQQSSHSWNGWSTFVHSSKGIMRKVEDDWRVAYLCRSPSTEVGSLCWKFDLCGSAHNIFIESVSVRVHSTTFESGRVDWLLCTEKSSYVIESSKKHRFDIEVSGCKVLSLHAFLSGGGGENAWQHAQLFRERLDDDSQPQLDIAVNYRSKE